MSENRSRHLRLLVEEAETLVAAGEFERISLDVLSLYNNFRSGWTEYVDTVFYNPQTVEEVELASRMRAVIEQTMRVLLMTTEPGKGFMAMTVLRHIAGQLAKLGETAPSDLVAQVRTLILKSERMGASPDLVLHTLQVLSELDGASVSTSDAADE